MILSDVWRDVGRRIGFYTKETSCFIPSEAGVYAWFLPLWLYDKDLANLVKFVQQMYLFDADPSALPTAKGRPLRSSRVRFNWESADIQIERTARYRPSKRLNELWGEMLADHEKAQNFAKALMEATIFTRPLYVGKADDLQARYCQHVAEVDSQLAYTEGGGDALSRVAFEAEGRAGDRTENKNEFRARFMQYMASTAVNLRVSDLLFVCVRTTPETSKVIRDDKLNYLLEQVLMQLVCPPFSCR